MSVALGGLSSQAHVLDWICQAGHEVGTRCLPDSSPKPKSCRSRFPETAEAPFEPDADGDGSFQSVVLGGRCESGRSF